MLHKKQFAVLYLDRNSFTYYSENSALTFTYPAGSIRELDFLNEQLFIKEAISFIQSNKIIPTTVMFILSPDIIYEKIFTFENEVATSKNNEKLNKNESVKEEGQNNQLNPAGVITQKRDQTSPSPDQHAATPDERTRQVQAFIDIVPFEEIASKSYKIDKGIKVIVTNKKLYELLINIVAELHFIVDSVVPVTVIPKDIIQTPSLNQDIARNIIKKFELVRQNSLLEENSYALSRAALQPHGITMSTKVTTMREYVLIGVFLTLLIALGIVTYTMILSPSKNRKIASITEHISPTIVILPTVLPTSTPAASASAEIKKEILRIQISGGTNQQVNLLRDSLLTYGYKNIIGNPNNIPSSGKALIIFTSSLPSTVKEELLLQIRRSFLNVSAQDVASPGADVIINL